MKRRWVIFYNDTRTDKITECATVEEVFWWLRTQPPETLAVQEWVGQSPGVSTNGETWLEENDCPCCGHRRDRPLTEDEEKALDECRPGPRY